MAKHSKRSTIANDGENFTRVCTTSQVRPGLTAYAAGEDAVAHVCPVCGGNGLRAREFYGSTNVHDGVLSWLSDSTTQSVACRSCDGTGIVWHE